MAMDFGWQTWRSNCGQGAKCVQGYFPKEMDFLLGATLAPDVGRTVHRQGWMKCNLRGMDFVITSGMCEVEESDVFDEEKKESKYFGWEIYDVDDAIDRDYDDIISVMMSFFESRYMCKESVKVLQNALHIDDHSIESIITN